MDVRLHIPMSHTLVDEHLTLDEPTAQHHTDRQGMSHDTHTEGHYINSRDTPHSQSTARASQQETRTRGGPSLCSPPARGYCRRC
jgi:hypothetical protein